MAGKQVGSGAFVTNTGFGTFAEPDLPYPIHLNSAGVVILL